MLSEREILEKIQSGESSGVEFKEVKLVGGQFRPHRDGLSDEIAAFANQQGGVVIFGVSDNREILGIDIENVPKLIHFITEICHDLVEPPLIDYFVDSIRVSDETGEQKTLVYINITRSLWAHQSSNGFFLRQGDTRRKMTTEQLGRLLQARSQARIISFDEQFVPNTNKDTLRQDLYQRFIPKGFPDQEVEDLLKRRLLVKEGREYRASVAGVLMCHDNPDEYLYNSFIQAVFYRSKERDANYQIDAKDCKGPLDQQIIDAFKFVEKFNEVSARKDIGRIERPQYSMRAVFEALVNAVVHRDYSKIGSKIRLFMFSDRLELYSPGALANTVTVENLRYAQATRNELLARLLSEITLHDTMSRQVTRRHFLERRGEGVGIILNESETLSGQTPVYELFDEELRLTIFAAKSLQEV